MSALRSSIAAALVGLLAGGLSAQPSSVIRGDANGNQILDGGDAVFLINDLFAGGTPTVQPCTGDVNLDGVVSVLDVDYLAAYLFGGGPAPLQAVELCNGVDDDCDGAIDEGDACGVQGPAWLVTGNPGVQANQFLGTSNAMPLVIKTAGMERMRIAANGNVGIGTSAPQSALHIAIGYLHLPVIPIEGLMPEPLFPEDCDEPRESGRAIVSTYGNYIFVCSNESWNTIDLTSSASINTMADERLPVKALQPAPASDAPARWQLDGNVLGSADAFIGTTDAFPIAVNTNAVERLHVAETGEIGVGTSSPRSALQIAVGVQSRNGGRQVQLPTSGTSDAPPAADCDSAAEAGRVMVNYGADFLDVCDGVAWRRIRLCRGIYTNSKLDAALVGTFSQQLSGPVPPSSYGDQSNGGQSFANTVVLTPPANGLTIAQPTQNHYVVNLDTNVTTASAFRVRYTSFGISTTCNYTVSGRVTSFAEYDLKTTVADGPQDRLELTSFSTPNFGGLTLSGCSVQDGGFARGVIQDAIQNLLIAHWSPDRCASCTDGFFSVCSTPAVGQPAIAAVPSRPATDERTSAVNAVSSEWLLSGNSGTNVLGTSDANPLVFKTAGIERMRMTPQGLIGIGTSDPQSVFQVVGYLQLSTRSDAGPPSFTDCDSGDEIGRSIISTADQSLYVCSASGWAAVSLP